MEVRASGAGVSTISSATYEEPPVDLWNLRELGG